MEPIVTSFVLVAVSEMGDKTQLLAFSLASRYRRPWVVMAGILVATVLNHALAASVGTWVSAQIPPRVMAGILAATFIGFGVWTLKPDTLEESKGPSGLGPFLTTTILFFLAEMADKIYALAVARYDEKEKFRAFLRAAETFLAGFASGAMTFLAAVFLGAAFLAAAFFAAGLRAADCLGAGLPLSVFFVVAIRLHHRLLCARAPARPAW